MLDSCRPARPAALRSVVPSLLVAAWLAPVARAQTSEPPPRSDTITAISQFLACQGNAYALCYYSGPEDAPPGTVPVPALPCVLGEHGKFAKCKCYAFEDGTSVNYVSLPSILDPEVRRATIETCREDGSGCLNMANERRCAEDSDSESESDSNSDSDSDSDCQTAPVCAYLGNVESGTGQTLYPEGTLVSTFSFEHALRYPISSTDCCEECGVPYAGCMTAACGEPYPGEGGPFTDCHCPTYVGPFQFGQSSDALKCYLGETHVWSAADLEVSLSPPDPPAGGD